MTKKNADDGASQRRRRLVVAAAAAAVVVLLLPELAHGQQPYENNFQLDCDSASNASTLGYSCNSSSTRSCTSFLFLRSLPPYQSPTQIAALLNASPSNISAANPNSSSAAFPLDSGVIVPVPCSCSGGEYYQHNASYTLRSPAETFFTVANDTYQGLTTCQAISGQNPDLNATDIVVGDELVVPVRCACPTKAQLAAGFKYLLSYLITWGDDVPTIAQLFNASPTAVWKANELGRGDTIFPFTTLLIPLESEPVISPAAAAAPPPSPPTTPTPPTPTTQNGGGSDHKWVFVGIGIAVGFLILASAGLLGWWLFSRRRRSAPAPPPTAGARSPELYAGLSGKSSTTTWPIVPADIRSAIKSIAVYTYGDLEKATGSFSEANRIRGSVYKAVINGDEAAVKRLKGDVTGEINILKHVNHSSVIRLSGFCLHEGNTFLVYEFAEKGSLADRIHGDGGASSSSPMTWKQRVQVAYDVADGLNYLHNYASPPYVHKDLKSSNILLDGEFRGKIANFALARAIVVDEEDEQQLHLTRHVVGTQGYMAPEYLEHGLVTAKLDVFSYGVVLLELLSGKEPVIVTPSSKETGELKAAEALLSESIKHVLAGEDARTKMKAFMDPVLREDYPSDMAFAMASLAMSCVAHEPSSRPGMAEVLVSMLAIYNATLDWDPSDAGDSGSMIHGR